MGSARRLTGVAGRWSATHPWTAIAVWLGCVMILLLTGHLVGSHQLSSSETAVGQSGEAQQMISRNFADEARSAAPVPGHGQRPGFRRHGRAGHAAVRAVAAAHPRITIAETGDATITKAVNDTVLADLHRAEALSFPITLMVHAAL
jgi:hypothetical protein